MSVKVVLNANGILRVIQKPDSHKVLLGGKGSPGSSARTGASLNFEGPFADAQELGGFYVPGDDKYVAEFCAAYTASRSLIDQTVTITRNQDPFGTIFFPAGNGEPVYDFIDGTVAFRDLIQFFANSPADAAFAASAILYILLAGR